VDIQRTMGGRKSNRNTVPRTHHERVLVNRK
jgi:hypothetical protein